MELVGWGNYHAPINELNLDKDLRLEINEELPFSFSVEIRQCLNKSFNTIYYNIILYLFFQFNSSAI